MSKARDLADFGSNPDEQTSIITVTVAGGKFVIDGTSQQTITMAASGVYKFDQSDSSNASHPLKISTTSDGTHGGGSAITVDFVAVGTAGSAGAYVTYTIQQDGADNYFYYCGNHSGMGGSIRKSGNPTAAEILTSIKTVDGNGSGLDADTLDGVEAAALLPLSGGTMTGTLQLSSSTPFLNLTDTDTGVDHTISGSSGIGSMFVDVDKNSEGSNPQLTFRGQGNNRLNIDMDGGDVSFFENTGSTKNFYWDASTSRLGLGTTSPATALDVTGTVQADQFNNDEALPDIRPSLLLDFANSKTLDPRITFTRGSTATYYDGKTTAKAEENLTTRSQEFNNWSLTNGTVTADSTTAPDGTTTADTFTATGANANISLTKTYGDDGDATFSVYIKRKTGTGNVEISHTIFGTATVVSVTSDWQRFEVTTTLSSASRSFGIELVTSGDEVYLWGAQLEERSAATAYTPTTSAPVVKYQPTLQTAASGEARFDHDPVTSESKGLLIEEARTNLNASSIVFGNNNESTSTTAALLAPDGTLAASKIVENTASSEHGVTLPTVTYASGTTYTLSVFAKSDGVRTGVRLLLPASNFGNNKTCIYNLSNGTLINGTVSGAPDASSITDVGNGWYRCTITNAATADGGATAGQIRIDNDPSNTSMSYVGNGFNGIYLWGAQIEVGSFPTSYIPTSGSTVTRAVDAAAITGSNFDFFSSSEGTIYSEHQSVATVNQRIYCINDGSNNNTFNGLISTSGGGGVNFEVRKNGVGYATQPSGTTPVAGQIYRLAAAYAYNDVAASRDGNTVGTDTSVITPEVNQMLIGSQSTTSNQSQVTIKKIAIYPKRLSNATLQAMTTE